MQKKIALLHRYPANQIKETNAAYPYLAAKGIDTLTFKKFNRLSKAGKFFKSVLWIFYAPLLVLGKKYDIIYCDDSYPFYPLLVKLASPKSRIVLRVGDLHLMYYVDGWLYKVLHHFERMTWRMADLIIAISDEMKNYMMIETVCNAVTVLDPVDPKDFPIDGACNSGSIMFHGVLTKNKNIDVLLQAAELLPEFKFEIVGDGPDYARLVSIAPKNVVFHGWIPFNKVSNKLKTCSIGVALRSDNRGNEYVVTSPFLQYGILGKPCLVTRRSVFNDYPWQFSTAEEMAQKIKILLNSPDQGKSLQKYIVENHSAEKIAEEIWRLLQ